MKQPDRLVARQDSREAAQEARMRMSEAVRVVGSVAAAVTVVGCGSGGSAMSSSLAASRADRSVASPTPTSLMDRCTGERYAQDQLPSKYARVLRSAHWKYFVAWARVGQVAVVNVVYDETADAHERAVVFIRGDKIIAADAAGAMDAHFDARICSLGGDSVVTGYWYRMGMTGPESYCPAPRPTFATVRWRVTANVATPLDHIPGDCR